MKFIIKWGGVVIMCCAAVTAILLLSAAMSTWAGSLILPEMGLHNPAYWSWFKFSFVLSLSGFFAGAIRGAIKAGENR